MLTKRKKLSKKEIKEDKLVTVYYKVYGFVEENRKNVLIGFGVLLAVAAAIYFYISQKDKTNEQAALELSRVMASYNSGAFLEAIEGKQGGNNIGLKRIVEDYGSSENGETAKIYLASSYSMLGKLEEAYKYYEDYSGSIDVLNAASLAGQASYFEYKKDYEQALDYYLQASKISPTNPSNSDYLLRAGINYLNLGKKDEAKEILEEITENYQTSPAAREVNKYLVLINE